VNAAATRLQNVPVEYAASCGLSTLTLGGGVALWVVYGFLKSDIVIILANAISLALLFGILYFKLRERRAPA
jgi:uncharacterized protein with PQ loop repeat